MNKAMIRVGLCSIAAFGLLTACGGVEEYPSVEQEQGQDQEIATAKSAILGADLCKDVDLTFVNSRERATGNVAIRVRRVKFYSEHDQAWHSEDFTNRVVGYGDSVTVENQDLENVYFEDLIDWKVYYNVLQSDGTWGSEVHQDITITGSARCEDFRGYRLTIN